MVHFNPDSDVVPCVGCNELCTADDLIRHGHHRGTSTYFWHPLHLWCIRRGLRPSLATACEDCHAPFAPAALAAAVYWTATEQRRLGARRILATSSERTVYQDDDAHVERPAGIRAVAVWRIPRLGDPDVTIEAEWVLPDEHREIEAHIRGRYSFVHDDCCEDEWSPRLRAAPADNDLRAVYADWLEERDDLGRAMFVRLAVDYRSDRGVDRSDLLELHGFHPSSWVRDVCKRT